jgi:UDP-N-acetylglucosamine 2-epimerase (non-hydrolysing)
VDVPADRLRLIDPVGYLDFMKLMKYSVLVLTDSGGIQEETTVLGIPCLTIRANTERPITVDVGTNTLVGMDRDRIVSSARKALATGAKGASIPELWDGHAAERIAACIDQFFHV